MSFTDLRDKKKYIFGFIFILCFAYLLYAFKEKIDFDALKSRTFDLPVSAIHDDRLTVVIDKLQTRINFLNEKNIIIKSINLKNSKIINNATDCDLDGNYVYINGSVRDKETSKVIKSRIIRYTYDGKFVDTIFEIDCAEDINFCETAIIDMAVIDGTLYLINQSDYFEIELYKKEQNEIKLIKKLKSDLPVYLANYNPQTNCIYYQNYLGSHYQYNLDTDSYDLYKFHLKNPCSYSVYTKNGLYYLDMHNKKIYDSENNPLITNTISYFINNRDSELFFCNILDNMICFYNIETKELIQFNNADASLLLKLKACFALFSIIYLILFLLIAAILKIIKLIKEENYAELKTLFYAIIFIFCSIGISVYYSTNLYKTKIDDVKSHVTYISKILANEITKSFSDEINNIQGIQKNTNFITDQIQQIYYDIVKDCDSFLYLNNDPSAYLCFYTTSQDNHFVFYDSNCNYQLGTPSEVIAIENENLNINDFLKVEKYKNTNGLYICSRQPVFDRSGKTLGIIEFGNDYSHLNILILKRCIELLIGLLVIGATLYMFIIELVSFVKTLIKRKQNKASGILYNESLFSRQYAFLADFVNGIDIIITTFTLKEICQLNNFNSAKTAFIISLIPFVLYSGSFIGSVLYSFLINRTNVKKFNFVCTTGMFVFILIQIYGIKCGNIFLFLAGKFFYFISQMNIYILSTAIADNAADDKSRYEYHKGTTWASVTAGVLSSALGGYIAEIFGNIYVYFAAAGLTLILLVFGILILPSNKIYGKNISKQKKEKSEILQQLKFVISPRVITYIIFISVPYAIIRNYKSLLFPLFSSDFNLPKIYISNIFIIARTLNMILSSKIDGITKAEDYRKQAVAALIFIGIMFGGFMLNDSIFWAAIMLVLSDLYLKMSSPVHKMIEGNNADSLNFPRDKAKGIVQSVNSLCSCLQTPILAFFLLFGTTKACIFIGGICIVFALLYFMFNFNRKEF